MGPVCLTVRFPEGHLKLILYTDNTQKSIAIATNGRNNYGQSSYAILACPGLPVRLWGLESDVRSPHSQNNTGRWVNVRLHNKKTLKYIIYVDKLEICQS